MWGQYCDVFERRGRCGCDVGGCGGGADGERTMEEMGEGVEGEDGAELGWCEGFGAVG